ncbi:40490_t:CDS:2, partial [Gigaspora margarita]
IDYQPDKIRLDVEIKKLFQKKEQEIVEILEKFKNRVLKKDQAVTKYLGIQHVELICIIREIIKEYDYIQYKIARAKDTLLQLEYSTHNYDTKELQATINGDESVHRPCKCKLEARELQEEIVRINGTTHLLEKESPTDIEMSEKEEVSSIIADITNKNLQPKQATATQEKEPIKSSRNRNTKTPCDMNSTGSIPERKLLKKILERLGNLEGKQDLLKGIQNAKIQSSEMMTNSDHAIISALINLDHLTFNNNMAKTRAKGIKRTVYLYEEEQTEAHIVDQTWNIIVNSIMEAANICLPKKRLQYLINNRRRQKKEKKSKIYKTIVQLSKWIRKGKKNQNQKINAALREEMNLSIREINKKLNVKIASIEKYWLSKLIQDLKE